MAAALAGSAAFAQIPPPLPPPPPKLPVVQPVDANGKRKPMKGDSSRDMMDWYVADSMSGKAEITDPVIVGYGNEALWGDIATVTAPPPSAVATPKPAKRFKKRAVRSRGI